MSDASWSAKLRLVTDLERPDHWHLQPDDKCAFFGEYAARQGYTHSDTNQIIANLKKKPELKNTGQWPHKVRAMAKVSLSIARNLTPDGLSNSTFVPMPSSKTKQHPQYDDRMAQVVRGIGANIDMREILATITDRDPMHESSKRRDPEELEKSISVDQSLITKKPNRILLIDDLLTTGCSFKVCSKIIRQVWPDIPIVGIFVARRVIPQEDFGFDVVED